MEMYWATWLVLNSLPTEMNYSINKWETDKSTVDCMDPVAYFFAEHSHHLGKGSEGTGDAT